MAKSSFDYEQTRLGLTNQSLLRKKATSLLGKDITVFIEKVTVQRTTSYILSVSKEFRCSIY